MYTCVGHVFVHHPSKVPQSSCLWASRQGMPGIHMPDADSREHAQRGATTLMTATSRRPRLPAIMPTGLRRGQSDQGEQAIH